jgi:hypothetical protein
MEGLVVEVGDGERKEIMKFGLRVQGSCALSYQT